ncbi:MAG: tRNA (adenosine(37)-N6)-threonylcarbamoyltransferase complex dimerization subunit type 1 TsaB [Cryomorphaceae bacterium]|nr:MAG: tRNA (adenosine(37)-N6)-threonylcarbamoyltransferase complex dimerization subunit type 1 TsaB [Cryomorphaceae bacterium]
MALILCIDTATHVCSVALTENGSSRASRCIQSKGYSHAENLHLMIDEVMREANVQAEELVAVAVSMGPGSYTGLRIGMAAAKGLCYALNLPLIGVSTLELVQSHPHVTESGPAFVVPMIDARRNEVYAAVYDMQGDCVLEEQPVILDEHPFERFLNLGTTVFAGDGSDKFRDQCTHPNAVFVAEAIPDAKNMGPLALRKLTLAQTESLAYSEPHYLKEFIAGKPKKLL